MNHDSLITKAPSGKNLWPASPFLIIFFSFHFSGILLHGICFAAFKCCATPSIIYQLRYYYIFIKIKI